MGFFDKFPYTNFQELNLDWIMQEVSKVRDNRDASDASAAAAKQSENNAAASKQQAGDYASAAHTAELGAQHNADRADAAADSIMQARQQIDTNTERIDNILVQGTPTEGNAELIDIRSGADGITYPTAGDAVRGQYSVLFDDIREYNSFDSFQSVQWTTGVVSGLTITCSQDHLFTVTGTTTEDINFNVYANTSVLPGGIQPGDHLILQKDVTGNIPDNMVLIGWYVNGAWRPLGRFTDRHQPEVPAGATGMLIRFYAASGVTINGTVRLRCMRQPSNAAIREVLPVVLPTTDVDLTGDIQNMLASYGTVVLGPGEYRIANLVMPDDSSIRGAGDATVLVVVDGTQGLIPGSGCSISNLKLRPQNPGHTGSAGTTEAGIYIQGNGSSAPFKYLTRIENVTCEGFNRAGIEIRNTGYWVANGAQIHGCKLVNNYYGIYLHTFAEFIRMSDCLIYGNQYGIMNCSGNNTFINCDVTENVTGVYIEGGSTKEGADTCANNGHGSFIGGTINHSDGNNGYAVICRGVDNGFIFSGVNIWYGKILANPKDESTKCSLIQFDNCLLGGGTPTIQNYGSKRLLMGGCTFAATPSFVEYPQLGQPITRINCYQLDGTAVN